MCVQEFDFMTRFVFYEEESVIKRLEIVKMTNDDFEKFFNDAASEIAQENTPTEPN